METNFRKNGGKVLPIIFGIISGIVTGLGMGGGTILILLISLFMNVEQHIAQAINLVFFIPTSISAIIINMREKNIDYKLAGVVIICGIIGAVIGAIISQNISSNNLRKYFAAFILLIAIYEIYKLYKEYRITKKKKY